MAEGGAPIGELTDRGVVQRAPYAVAAALAVLAGGAAFLAYAMSRPTAPAVTLSQQPAPGSPTAETRLTTAAVEVTPDPDPAASAGAAIDAPPPADITASFGGPLRINPSRSADASGVSIVPQLKPKGDGGSFAQGAAAAAEATVLSFASAWIADESDRPAPFFFESDIAAEPVPSAGGLSSLDGDLPSLPHEVRIALEKGETFVDALRRAGVRAEDRNEAALSFGKLHNMRRLRPGQEFVMTVAQPNMTFFQYVSAKDLPPLFLLSLDFRIDPENRIALSRAADGSYEAAQHATPLTTRIAAVQGRIDGSLYMSAKRQGAPDEVIAGLAQMFAYDVDFQREIFGGDEFEAIFEVRYDETGKMVGGGDILFGRLNWRSRSKQKGYYRFQPEDGGGSAEYFDAAGESARRLLMKTPIDGARLSSGFGTRKHPILGYQKAHKGVDFAASRGTPIMAAGDGVIERSGPYGSFGNYVRIRHAQGYKTAYAHMNAIKKGVRTGARVRQGEVIGYVGSTGRSTGPHLHYEVHLKDKPVNPQSLKIATGYELGGKELTRFRDLRDRIDAMRAPAIDADTGLVADADKGRQL